MAGRRWHIAEDELVCGFYLSHPVKATADFSQLQAELARNGFERGIPTIKARYLNYRYLATGTGLSHCSKQQRDVFARLSE